MEVPSSYVVHFDCRRGNCQCGFSIFNRYFYFLCTVVAVVVLAWHSYQKQDLSNGGVVPLRAVRQAAKTSVSVWCTVLSNNSGTIVGGIFMFPPLKRTKTNKVENENFPSESRERSARRVKSLPASFHEQAAIKKHEMWNFKPG